MRSAKQTQTNLALQAACYEHIVFGVYVAILKARESSTQHASRISRADMNNQVWHVRSVALAVTGHCHGAVAESGCDLLQRLHTRT